MPRSRRTLTDAEILSMAINTRAARELRRRGSERRAHSIPRIAVYLQAALVLLTLTLIGTFAWKAVERSEQHGDHCTGADARVECSQRVEAQRAGEGMGFVHPASLIPSLHPFHIRRG